MGSRISQEASRVDFYNALDELIEGYDFKVSLWAKSYLADMLDGFIARGKMGWAEGFEEELRWGQEAGRFKVKESEGLYRIRLKEVGDYCLFATGYLYDLVRGRGEAQVRHYYEVGSSAYGGLGYLLEVVRKEGEGLFFELSDKFKELSQVIWNLHSLGVDDKRVLEYYSKWLRTNDERYASLLKVKGVLVEEGNDKIM